MKKKTFQEIIPSSSGSEYKDTPEDDFEEGEQNDGQEEGEEKKSDFEPTPSVDESEEKQEVNFETEEIDTMKDFIDSLKWDYDATEDPELKQKLAFHIVKLEMALQVSGLTSDAVYVRYTPEGVLGYFDPQAKKIAISREELEDFNTDQQLYNTVLYHEKTHKEGIADEGLTQKLVVKKISATPGVYTYEQTEAQKTFYKVGLDKALDLYEIEKPQKLTEYYLEVELEKLWNEKLRSVFQKKSGKKDAKKILKDISKNDAERLERSFKDGVPRLYDKLKSMGYSIKDMAQEVLQKLSEKKS